MKYAVKTSNIDIGLFERNTAFYGEMPLLLTVKSFDLQAIRKRYLASRKNISGKTGSVERRKAGEGGIVALSIAKGAIQKQDILCTLTEPRGIAISPTDSIAIAAENVVFIIDPVIRKIENDWFSYIHTVAFSGQNKILISSSGLDTIFEYNLQNLEPSWEWNAWDHGINKAHDPADNSLLYLTRSKREKAALEKQGLQVLLVENPLTQHLPTAMRAAFINSVVYDNADPDKVIATFFHEGAVYSINKNSGEATKVLDKLKNPHGGCGFQSGFMATSTASGEIVIGNKSVQERYHWKGLPGKPAELEGLEWVQNAVYQRGIFIAIDSNRTSFLLFDPVRKLYDMVPFNPDWAVQDLVIGAAHGKNLSAIKSLKTG